MKFHYAGEYNGDPESLPQREHHENAVQFQEPDDMKKLSAIMNTAALIVTFILMFIVGFIAEKKLFSLWSVLGFIASMISLVPHEFLHALCFKNDVHMYQNLKQGMLFVVGTEDMSKLRFIMMCLCPNIVFGFIPFIVFLIFPNLVFFGTLGAIAVGMGAGDYLNVYYALTQVPNGATVYNSGMHSYWYK